MRCLTKSEGPEGGTFEPRAERSPERSVLVPSSKALVTSSFLLLLVRHLLLVAMHLFLVASLFLVAALKRSPAEFIMLFSSEDSWHREAARNSKSFCGLLFFIFLPNELFLHREWTLRSWFSFLHSRVDLE